MRPWIERLTARYRHLQYLLTWVYGPRLRVLLGIPEISQRRVRSFARRHGRTAAPAWTAPPASVAIVVPCYRHEEYFERMFESILQQTRMPDEVVIVDDNSPDGTCRLAKQLARRVRRRLAVRVLRNHKNLGQCDTINRGVSSCTSDLVMILNDDDYLLPDAVEVMMELFGRHPELSLIGGHSVHFSGDREIAAKSRPIRELAGDRGIALSLRTPEDARAYRSYNDLNMTHSGSCFRKEAWARAGGYYRQRRKRLVPQSDRDFQLRMNALFPVAASEQVPFSMWRTDSSVDAGVFS